MTKHFNTTFTYLGQEITVSKTVTDRQEERASWKKVFASDWMTQMLRNEGLFKRSCIHAKDLVEVKKSEMVSFAETVAQIKDAEERFAQMSSSEDKVALLLANMNGYTL